MPQNALAPSDRDDSTPAQVDQPSVWLLLSEKRGDNGQVEVLAEALGWTCERKYFAMRAPYVYGKPRVKASLHHIDPAESDELKPPWPDLIITVGRRPTMVALWIREQSGGRTKIVVVGKPSGRLQWFDLIVSSQENAIAPYPNVTTATLPLMRVDEAKIAEQGALWKARLEALPRPLIGVLVGGPTRPFVYKDKMIERLLQVCRDIVEKQGGTPYVTTSRRTPKRVAEALETGLPPEAKLFTWSPEATDNPYQGLLATADGFVVTADSISMAVEVAQLRKPLAILPVTLGAIGTIDQYRRNFIRWVCAPGGSGLRHLFARTLYRAHLINPTRNFDAFYQLLFDRGLAVPAGQPFTDKPGALPHDVPAAVARIKALMASG